ncbi:DUF397 domain-containing protein [Nocardiopsis sp. RSe5-2]|uniref:DUF397 domain-containing protein n=1 Tax=Nocardiopsis endophytica TaxID=3018445 RepID=A0ABT4U4Z8_9ACTN|nr:DUF397 domain-containing protein [Nocardiopsis endophytica]MDA2812018.1 DUF397 domain-containing protein [Nocardiopsis endophytica]
MTSDWVKSTFSKGGADNCVECRSFLGRALVRDTQNRNLGHLSSSSGEWVAFLAALRGGRW